MKTKIIPIVISITAIVVFIKCVAPFSVYVYQKIRMEMIYNEAGHWECNRGAKFPDYFTAPHMEVPWGIKKPDLKFMLWRDQRPFSENTHAVLSGRESFYFNSNNQLAKIKTYFGNTDYNGALLSFENHISSLRKSLLDGASGTYQCNIKWINNSLPDGFESKNYTLEHPIPPMKPNGEFFSELGLSMYIDNYQGEYKVAENYPGFEIHMAMEFQGMAFEHYLLPNPDNAEEILHEAVYYSTVLS